MNENDVLKMTKRIFKIANYTKTPFLHEVESVYRAVAHSNKEWFDSLKKFGCPPSHVTKLNRCTWKRESAFYCSSDNAVPFFEIRAQKGDYISLSSWISKKNSDLDPVLYPIKYAGFTLGIRQILSHPNCNESLRKLLLKDDIFKENFPDRLKGIDEVVGQLFSEKASSNPNLYYYTSAIAKTYFQCLWPKGWPVGLQGLMYPSVESELSGVNIVLTKQFAQNFLKLRGVALYQVENYDDEKRQYTLIPVESLQGSTEHPFWQKIHSKHEKDRFIFSPDTPKESFEKVEYLTLGEEKRYSFPKTR